MIIVHYEVYVLEGRGWMLHARFPRTERDAAINEAKELEHTLNIRVKVVRETYYTDTNAFDEAEVYLSGGAAKGGDRPKPAAPSPKSSAPRAAPVTATGGSAAPAKPAPAKSAPTRKPPPRRSPRDEEDAAKARQLIARLLGVTAVSLAVALLAIKLTPEVIILLWKMGFSVSVNPDFYSQLLIAVFSLSFLMTAVPLGMRFLPRKTKFTRPTFAWAAGEQTRATAPSLAFDPAVKKSLDKLASKALREQEGTKPDSPAEDQLPPLDEDLPPIVAGPDDVLPEIRPDPVEEAPPPAAESAKPERKEGGQSGEAQLPAVNRFLAGALDSTRTARVAMDAYNKFALHLYMAGAIESLCDFRKLGGADKTKLMNTALETLGTKGEMAGGFLDKLPDYRREARYAGVIEAGRGAMGNFLLGDEAGAHLALTDVFKDWNKKTTEKKAQLMTVLFTDMVGSTDMTQARGDVAAQEIVRRHNLIVRGALQQFGGHEVKHTGDGIMASFLSASAAVEAVIHIQRQVAQHNARLPNQALHLRIGLNAGEPIQEEDDLFGSTVQLAARVCAATESDEILCTDSVKDLSADKPGLVFKPVGNKHMKGFKDPIALNQVPWK